MQVRFRLRPETPSMTLAVASAILAPDVATSNVAGYDAAVRFACERAEDRAAVDALIDIAFGPGRFAKTAERLREGNRLRRDLSFCAWLGEELVSAVRQWPIRIGETPVIFLGPIATPIERRGQGYGRALVRHGCAQAAKAGETLVLLVGDRAYFEPLGFQPVPAGRVTLPGPVDGRRLLWAPLTAGGAHGVAGMATIAP
jgi:predicted N-acetyltransferase YhbS